MVRKRVGVDEQGEKKQPGPYHYAKGGHQNRVLHSWQGKVKWKAIIFGRNFKQQQGVSAGTEKKKKGVSGRKREVRLNREYCRS